MPHRLAEPGLTWYDQTALETGIDSALGGAAIELLVVDGPPAYAQGHGLARYPALPVLHDRLAPSATIILDDAERPGEREIIRRWQLETDLSFHQDDARAGLATATVHTARYQV
jgi:hypothetical protein